MLYVYRYQNEPAYHSAERSLISISLKVHQTRTKASMFTQCVAPYEYFFCESVAGLQERHSAQNRTKLKLLNLTIFTVNPYVQAHTVYDTDYFTFNVSTKILIPWLSCQKSVLIQILIKCIINSK